MLPQGLRVRKDRLIRRELADPLAGRPVAVSANGRRPRSDGFAVVLAGLFQRVDGDGSGSVSPNELLDFALPHLPPYMVDTIREAFQAKVGCRDQCEFKSSNRYLLVARYYYLKILL